MSAALAVFLSAPTTTVSPLMATEMPKWSSSAPSEARGMATCLPFGHRRRQRGRPPRGPAACAVFPVRPDDDGVPADGHRLAKVVIVRAVGGGQLAHLAPAIRPRPGCAQRRRPPHGRVPSPSSQYAPTTTVSPLMATDSQSSHRPRRRRRSAFPPGPSYPPRPGCAQRGRPPRGRCPAVFTVRPDDDGVPADGHRAAKMVIVRAVGGGQLGHLAPVIGPALVALKE